MTALAGLLAKNRDIAHNPVLSDIACLRQSASKHLLFTVELPRET